MRRDTLTDEAGLLETIADPTTASTIAAGERVGRFVVLETLGVGGMGVVLAAYDEDLDRKVALKLMKPTAPAADGTQRLLREARAMAKLDDVHVVTVHEVGTFGGQVFVAMEYASGGTLRAYCQKPRSWQDVVEKLCQAGRGLGFGLCKVWRIVTGHGGRIEVESEPGEVTRFKISWPSAELASNKADSART